MASPQSPSPAWQLRAFPWLTSLGWAIIAASLLIGLLVLTPTAASYWGSNGKATRDAAELGSNELGQLETLNAVPRWLEPLTFLGVAAFMLGIALEFSSIPQLLRNRGQVMRICFPLIAQYADPAP